MTAGRDRTRRAGRPLRARAAGAALLAALTLAGCGTAGYGAPVAPSPMSVSSEAFVSGIAGAALYLSRRENEPAA